MSHSAAYCLRVPACPLQRRPSSASGSAWLARGFIDRRKKIFARSHPELFQLDDAGVGRDGKRAIPTIGPASTRSIITCAVAQIHWRPGSLREYARPPSRETAAVPDENYRRRNRHRARARHATGVETGDEARAASSSGASAARRQMLDPMHADMRDFARAAPAPEYGCSSAPVSKTIVSNTRMFPCPVETQWPSDFPGMAQRH